jgi:SAM-dependent methyltransferase
MSEESRSVKGTGTPPIDFGELHNEFDQVHAAVFEAFRLITKSGKESLLDYGSGPGAWCLYGSQVFDRVFGVDISEAVLDSARSLATANEIDNVTFINLRDLETVDLPPLDSMISIGVIELAQSSEVIDIFRFAATHLKVGGRFLCNSRRPISFFRTLILLERFSVEGVFRGGRRTLALLRSAIEAIISPEIKSISRARHYHAPEAIIGLAERSGLRLEAGPVQLAKSPTFELLDWHCVRRWFFNIRQTDWYVFEKAGADSN